MINGDSMAKIILAVAAFLGAGAVMLGAFSAHYLAPLLEANGRTATFTTANHYHFFHTLALMLLGVIMMKNTSLSEPLLLSASVAFLVGIIFFSGSLYILSLTTHWSFLGAVAPVGGLAFVIGWVLLAITFLKDFL